MSESARSPLRTLHAWRRQRFQHALFVPGAGVLAFASAVAAPSCTVMQASVSWATAWLLLAGLRLGDDLMDRTSDAALHPERVLTRVTTPRPFWMFACILVALGCLGVAWISGPAALVIIAVITGCVSMAAYARPTLGEPAEAVILAKYPAIVLALAASVRMEAMVVMTLVYGVMCIDEAVDRASLRPLAIAACSVSTIAILWLFASGPTVFTAVQIVVIAMAAVGLSHTFTRPKTPWIRLGWMVWVVIQLVNFDLGHP